MVSGVRVPLQTADFPGLAQNYYSCADMSTVGVKALNIPNVLHFTIHIVEFCRFSSVFVGIGKSTHLFDMRASLL